MSIFDLNNPNADLFIVPTEEGSDDDDNRIASIGDATLKHIDALDGSRIIYDSFICMPDGNLFQMEENLSWRDPDEFNLRSVDDLQQFMRARKIPEKYLPIYQEALSNELSRRETSEDVMDQKDFLVSYDDWEANPGLMSHWDVPATPKPRARYVGNCRQTFYDQFPDDHPDADFINSVLFLLNKEWEEITPRFVSWVIRMIEDASVGIYTKKVLVYMVEHINNNTDDPAEVIRECLAQLDSVYGKAFTKEAKSNEAAIDPIYRYFVNLCIQFDKEVRNGVPRLRIYNHIKLLGKRLLGKVVHEKNRTSYARDPLKEVGIRGRLKKRHWILYRRLKTRFAPPLMVNGVDINRAGRGELTKALGLGMELYPDLDNVDDEDGEALESAFSIYRKKCNELAFLIMSNRPFESINEIKSTGIVSYENITRKVPALVPIIDEINRSAKLAINNRKLEAMTSLPKLLIARQKANPGMLSELEWKAVWECYNMKKIQVIQKLKAEKKVGTTNG